MKRLITVPSLLFVILFGSVFGDSIHSESIQKLRGVFEKQLKESLSYQKALLQAELARYSLKQKEDIFVPYLQINNGSFQLGNTVGSSQGGSFSQPGSAGASEVGAKLDFSLQASFRTIFGLEISVSEPFSFDRTDEYTPELPRLILSRRLFDESGIEFLKTRAAYLKSEHNLREIESSVLIKLIQEIFDYHYYRQVREVQAAYAENYERLASFAGEAASERGFKKQWYTVQRGILESENALDSISTIPSELETPDINSLYEGIKQSAKTWEEKLPAPDTRIPPDGSIESLKMILTAAERERALWFLPYLPNPTVSTGFSYDLDQQALQWTFGIDFNIDIIDRGERASRSMERKKGVTLARLELEDSLESDALEIKEVWRRKQILHLDYQIAELNKEEKQEDFQAAEPLYRGGFISEEEYQLRQLDYRNTVLAAERAYHLYLLQILRIFQKYDIRWLPWEM